MPLVPIAHRVGDTANRQRDSRTLDVGSLSIGRGPSSGWMLDDLAQHLSKTHCVVAAVTASQDGRSPARFLLTDCSSNGTFLNGARARIPRDSQAPLHDGDEFALGDYVVQVRVVQAETRSGAHSRPVPAMPPTEDMASGDPFGLDDFLAPRPAAPALRTAPMTRDPFDAPRHATPGHVMPGHKMQAQAAPGPGTGRDAFGDDDDLFHGAGALFAAMVESLRDVPMSRAIVRGSSGSSRPCCEPSTLPPWKPGSRRAAW